MMNARQMPLAFAPEEARLAVTGLAGCKEMQKRLSEMGLHVGGEVKVIRGCVTGPLLLAVGKSRLALGQEMSRKIFVTPLQDR
ncbi:ferrous iron transport protein A [Rhodobacter sphaeroides]|jgi:ferrous iron transport protein A|uniref:Ferrous iron transport protein A n=2 Tax=Cereibacter sphaeroides TaxID=1063 RepID=Q3J5G7_CERS4|nr:FeoA family protein [Cereibacter sphaeroides]ABN75583.1 FeoA family protein [Cereibacter sphaeroides ATCC 17029]ABA77967.1 ferrous iron transport protein A [Cereibacter sphaeroides 2.4.1]AMJ46350.1 iron transporter FeoA [Cereibacter sphaeroides]ANS33061.1 iron transporter FeoA [Cereibacter sphaeroides]ATN62113.1 iron transporter FeoA [Cereibacter sphaeroides]